MGRIGTVITYDAQFKSMLFTICGGLVVIIGLMMWGVPFLRQISPELTKPCRFKGGRPLVIGLLTGLMPCGALASMWLFAAASGSAAEGRGKHVRIWTWHLRRSCSLFGAFGALVPAKYNKYILKVSTVLIVSLGLILLSMGIRMI